MTCSLCLHNAKDGVVVYSVMNPIARWSLALPPVPHRLLDRAGIICTYDYNSSTSSSFRVVLIPNFSTKLKVVKVHIFSSDTSKWSKSVVLCLDQEGLNCINFPYQRFLIKVCFFGVVRVAIFSGLIHTTNSRFCHSVEIEGPVELTIISYIYSIRNIIFYFEK